MKFSEVKPFIRYAQRLTVTENSRENAVVARDCRLFFCTEGEGELCLSGALYKMQKGALVIIPAGREYTVLAPKRNTTGADVNADVFVRYIAVNYDYGQTMAHLKYPIPPVQAKYFKPSHIIEGASIDDLEELNEPLYLPRVHRVENKLNKVYAAYSKKVIFYEMEASALFLQVLIECMRCVKLNALNRRDSVFERVFEYIHENSHRKLTNKEIADVFGYNSNYISDLLKISTGLPLHKYLLGVRIERAIDLIDLGEMSIGEIAEECGFYDIYHFSKAFKAATGIPPSKYRR